MLPTWRLSLARRADASRDHPLQGTPEIDARKADQPVSVTPTVVSAKPTSCTMPANARQRSLASQASSPHPAPKDWSSS